IGRTDVVVVAVDGRVGAAPLAVADVVGAGVVVIAGVRTGLAGAAAASVGTGAGIAVLARVAVGDPGAGRGRRVDDVRARRVVRHLAVVGEAAGAGLGHVERGARRAADVDAVLRPLDAGGARGPGHVAREVQRPALADARGVRRDAHDGWDEAGADHRADVELEDVGGSEVRPRA